MRLLGGVFLCFWLMSFEVFAGNLPILQGATTEKATQFNVLNSTGEAFHYSVFGRGRKVRAKVKTRRVQISENIYTEKTQITGLRANVVYTLEVEDLRGKVLDRRNFSTIDPNKRGARIAFVSCANFLRLFYDPSMWVAVLNEKPEFVIFGGDNVYAGIKGPADPQTMLERYYYSRTSFPYFFSDNLIPTIATWDDHDTGTDNSDKFNPSLPYGRELFEAFYAQDPIGEDFERGPGIATRFDAFGQRFVLLDGRSFKEKEKTMFGVEQTRWAYEQLENSETPIWLLNGQQFYGTNAEGFDKDFPLEFLGFRDFLSSISQPVVFASGDIHFSEVQQIGVDQIGYETWEFTSSGIHSSRKLWGGMPPNPRRINGVFKNNFLMIESTPARGGLDLRYESVGSKGIRYFSGSMNLRR